VAWWGGWVLKSPLLLVLVVEDDHLIKEIIQEALSGGGFESEVVASGEEAVTLLQDKHHEYRALVTDINLQGELNGWDVAKRARELSPELPIVYMTGAAADQWPSHGVPGSVLLQKPFAPAQVVTAISQLLNQTPHPT
jgi:CheY-like chemotaxis protein